MRSFGSGGPSYDVGRSRGQDAETAIYGKEVLCFSGTFGSASKPLVALVSMYLNAGMLQVEGSCFCWHTCTGLVPPHTRSCSSSCGSGGSSSRSRSVTRGIPSCGRCAPGACRDCRGSSCSVLRACHLAIGAIHSRAGSVECCERYGSLDVWNKQTCRG